MGGPARRGLAGLAAALLLLGGCVAEPRETTILLDSPAATEDTWQAPAGELGGPEGSLTFPPHRRDGRRDAYHLVVETSGERETSGTPGKAPPVFQDSQLLELEFRELPVGAAHEEAYRLVLDALYYRLAQRNPDARRQIELARDRLRVKVDGKETLDLQGAQPQEDLTPRILLDRVFAVVAGAAEGRVSVRPRGTPTARRFLDALPVRQAIGYSRLPLPEGAVTPGASWHAGRFPVSPAGGLGLELPITYTLAGFETLEEVPCAWILLRADEDADDVASVAGFRFDRVRASLEGTAWVELATSRLRRLLLEDEIRVSYTRGREPAPELTHRMRHRSRLSLELRDPDQTPDTWSDGSERFGSAR